jgi:DNA repair protein RadC
VARHGFCFTGGGMNTYVDEPVRSAKGRLARRALHGGVEGLGDAELLALLLAPTRRRGSGLVSAGAILEALGGLEGLGSAGPRALETLSGLDPLRCLRVAAALEFGRRTLERLTLDEREVMGSLDSVVRWARPRLARLDHEQVWLLVLDGRNRLRSAQRVAQGGLHGCALTPGDVLRPAVRDAGSAMVLVHNHPSGDPEPSPEDLVMTRRVATAGELLGVPLLDHVIVARDGQSSLFELGALGHGH